MDKVMKAAGVEDPTVALAQGGTPEFRDVSEPTESDASQEAELHQTSDVSASDFSEKASQERDALPPNAKMMFSAYLNGAGSCLAGGDRRNGVICLQRAAKVASNNYAMHLAGELDRKVADATASLNGTHEPGYAERHVGPEGEQDNDAVEDLRQGPNTGLTAAQDDKVELAWSDASREAAAEARHAHVGEGGLREQLTDHTLPPAPQFARSHLRATLGGHVGHNFSHATHEHVSAAIRSMAAEGVPEQHARSSMASSLRQMGHHDLAEHALNGAHSETSHREGIIAKYGPKPERISTTGAGHTPGRDVFRDHTH